MKRGGTVLALAVLLSLGLSPAAAQDGTGTADVYLKEKGDDYYAGEDLLSADGAGQSRSLIIEDELVLIVKIQNDGERAGPILVEGTPGEAGFAVRYLRAGEDVTDEVIAGDLSLRIRSGRQVSMRIEVDASDAGFAATQRLLVRATADEAVDAATAEITKVS